MRVRVHNFRCIEEKEIELKKLNIFFGGNGTGKSSLAYAVFMASRASRGVDPDELSEMLLSTERFASLARTFQGKGFYPLEIELKDEKGGIKISHEEKAEKPEVSAEGVLPDSFMASAHRLGGIFILNWFRKVRESMEAEGAPQQLKAMMSGFLSPLTIPQVLGAAGAYWESLRRAMAISQRPFDIPIDEKWGKIETSPVIVDTGYFEMLYPDSISGLRLHPEATPAGFFHVSLVKQLLQFAPDGSIVVIEEPELHLNPLRQIDFMKEIVESQKRKDLVLIITTHSETAIYGLLSLVEKKTVSPEELGLFYTSRKPEAENPWTEVKEVKVYEDGTAEWLFDLSKIPEELF